MVAPRFGSEPKPGEKGVSSSPPIGAAAIHGLAVQPAGGSGMSALPPEADMLIVGFNVCRVPEADMSPIRETAVPYWTGFA